MSACRSVQCGWLSLRRRTCLQGRWAPSSIAVIFGLLSAFSAKALADDWQDCTSNTQERVLAGCSSVIDQKSRTGSDLSLAHVIRGDWYRARSRSDEALADYERAEQLDPQSYRAIAGRGATLHQKGQLDEALVYYERAIERDPQNSFGYFMRGQIRQQRRQFSEALTDFDHAINLRNDGVNYYSRRGFLYSQIGDFDRAIIDFDRAVALNPTFVEAFRGRGDVYRKRAEFDRAISDYTRAIVLSPKNALLFAFRGDVFNAKGDFDRAIADYDQALSIAPDNKRFQELKRVAVATKAELAKSMPPSAAPTTLPTATVPAGPNGDTHTVATPL
jgi:tetratricopeptide (TPR) repeat protein